MKTAFYVVLGLVALGLVVVQVLAAKRERDAAAAFPPTGQIIDVDGVSVHVEQMGEGPDLVLIHGASGNTRDFTFAFADRVKDRYRVTILDRPGLGWTDQILPQHRSAWTTTHANPTEQARLLKSATDQLGVKRPIVLGHSFGGIVALAWALEFDELAGIVSVAGVANPWPGELDWTYQVNGSAWGGGLMVPVLAAFVPDSYIDNAVSSIFAPQTAPQGYTDHVGPALILRRASMRANARQVNWLRPHVVEMSKSYGNITVPVEVVHGDADTIVPLDVHSAKLPGQIEGANVTVLPGVGHMPQHTHPQDVIEAIDRVAARAGLR
ncbi:alpha/beta hydrolase [Tateyamaria sp. ANG-S1]|uniref:alpha/beta fold hydrolase n=1 Tax=Tateyamaria sp. ANG-S1 TaxID=1577905 RepID=UPI00057F61CB|nr:alpha/beta hydrolase [Tateyamaria sp. ANG-S1]KIC48682.1 alpha/beta hydrolase [Tateyamaria sp. ANG-S1]